METINIRRSIRTFTEQKVEEEKIDKIIRAGMQAPSAHNQQAWEFLVVTDEAKKETLSNLSPYTKCLKDANVAIITLINKDNLKVAPCVDQDMGACTQNILLEVVEQGLGAVWMAVKPDPERMKMVSEVLELPDNIEPYSLVAVGYSDQENTFVDRYDATKVHYNKY